MAYDGKLQFNTAIDTSGFLSGISDINSIAQKGLGTIGNFAKNGIQSVVSFAETGADGIKKSVTLAVDAMKTVGKEAAELSKKAIEIGKSFESSMSQVAATMGITKDTINSNGVKPFEILSEAAKECGATTQFSASEAAEALNYLALAGYSAEQAADALPSVLNLAAAGGLDLQYAADLATDAMAALGITANNQNLTEFGDKMAKAAQKSNTSVGQLGEAILTVGGTAKELAGGTTELNTALGVLANVGIKGSEGGTALRNIMLAMTPTTDKAAAAFEKLGLESYDAQGNLRPLNETFKDLNKAMSGMSSKEKTETLNAIFNKVDLKSASAMLAACATSTEELGTAFSYAGVPAQHLTKFLADFENGVYNTMTETEFCNSVMSEFGVTSDKAGAIYSAFITQLNGISWENLYNEIENCDGAMEQMAETMNDNLEGDIKKWNSALEGFGISFYESIVGSLRSTVQDATEWIGRLDEAFKADGFNGLATAAGDVLGSMIESMFYQLPHILKIGNEFIENLYLSIREQEGQIKYMGASIITNLLDSFTENFDIFYTTGFWITDTLLSGLARKSDKLATFAADFINTITNNINDFVPSLLESGIKIITSVAQGISQKSPVFIARISETFRDILTIINSSLPELLETGTKIINQLCAGIRKGSDKTSSQAGEIIKSLAQFILENIPKLLAAGLTIAENLLDGISDGINDIQPAVKDFIEKICIVISEHLPDMLSSGLEILMSLINGITDNLPEIIAAAVQILITLSEFIGDNIDTLLEAAILIITTICNELLTEENLKKLISAAVQIIEGIAGGISENLPLLIDCAGQIIGEIMRYLNNEENRTQINKSAGKILGKLVKGLIDSLDEVRDFVAELLVELGIAISETDWKKLGKDIADGIMSGLLGVPFDGQEFKENFADNWITGIQDIFGISSPSKLMRDEIGVYLVPGIAEGVSETSGQLTDEMDSAVNTALDNIETQKDIDFELSALTSIDIADMMSRMEAAVSDQQIKLSPAVSMHTDFNISNEIRTSFEEALKNAELNSDTYLTVNIGQEKIEDMVISSIERQNARTGGRY